MTLKVYREAIPQDEAQKIEVFLKTHPADTIFQSPAFHHFYLGLLNYHPWYFVIFNAKNDVSAVLLAVIISEGGGLMARVSSRCVVYGGPIINADDPSLLALLLESLNKSIRNRAVFTQFRNFRIWDETATAVFLGHGFELRDRLNLIVTLKSKEAVLAGFSASKRRQLKKAFAAETVIRPAENMNEVRMLYHLLQNLYRNKVKKPLPPLSFFEQFFMMLAASGHGVILLVIYNGEIIGGIVSPVTVGHTISELYVCGLDREYPHIYPSVAATWAAMEYGLNNGIRYFDFMGLGKPDVAYGVRDFKLRFGGNQVNYGRFARRNNKMLYAIAEFGYNVLRTLKKI